MAEQASAYFRAVAIDFDGTLADRPVAPCTLAALAEVRSRQVRVILVTGRIGSRATPHLRHEHKYDQHGVEPARRFQFRTEPDTPTGAVAANLAELEAELGRCDEGVLRHHCPGRDFSRWVSEFFHLLLHAGLSRRTYEAIRLPVPVHLRITASAFPERPAR